MPVSWWFERSASGILLFAVTGILNAADDRFHPAAVSLPEALSLEIRAGVRVPGAE